MKISSNWLAGKLGFNTNYISLIIEEIKKEIDLCDGDTPHSLLITRGENSDHTISLAIAALVLGRCISVPYQSELLVEIANEAMPDDDDLSDAHTADLGIYLSKTDGLDAFEYSEALRLGQDLFDHIMDVKAIEGVTNEREATISTLLYVHEITGLTIYKDAYLNMINRQLSKGSYAIVLCAMGLATKKGSGIIPTKKGLNYLDVSGRWDQEKLYSVFESVSELYGSIDDAAKELS